MEPFSLYLRPSVCPSVFQINVCSKIKYTLISPDSCGSMFVWIRDPQPGVAGLEGSFCPSHQLLFLPVMKQMLPALSALWNIGRKRCGQGGESQERLLQVIRIIIQQLGRVTTGERQFTLTSYLHCIPSDAHVNPVEWVLHATHTLKEGNSAGVTEH